MGIFDEIREERKRRGERFYTEQEVLDLVDEARRATVPNPAEGKNEAGVGATHGPGANDGVDLGDGDDCFIWKIRKERKERGERFYSEREVIDLVDEAKAAIKREGDNQGGCLKR